MVEPRDYTVHMVGHGHIDPTWLWRWTEGFEEVRATFRSALDRMKETPEFRFTASSACFYAWVEACDPALFEAIQARVAEGRWELAGGWWVEPDCNVPCGESFVRQGLYAQRFFQRAFGRKARVGFNPDSFGHAGVFPQLLRKMGLKYYVYMRPGPVYERDYPEGTTFWWEAQDGSRVLTANIPQSYNADQETSERIARMPAYEHLNPGQRQLLGFYGVGNHGGGPTKQAIAQIQAADADPDMPAARFSTLETYLAAFEAEAGKDIPVVRDELQHHARGCYSVHAGVKAWNRRAEHALMNAERLASVVALEGLRPYPAADLAAAWQLVLYNQFHDILAGTSIESSYEDTRDQLGSARNTADTLANLAVQTLVRDIDTTPEGNTVVVFNPLPWAVREPVTVSPIVERMIDGGHELVCKRETAMCLVDDDEQPVPFQAVRGDQVGASRYAFTAEVPPLGYRCYHVRSGAAASGGELCAAPQRLENAWWRLDFDPATGAVAQLTDKQRGVAVLRGGNILACLDDPSDTWSHGVKAYDQEAGRFSEGTLAVAEEGPALARVLARSRFGASNAIVETTLYADLPCIDIHLRVNWQEPYRALKLLFETGIEGGTATWETPYGHQVRPATGEEEPGQQWFDLTGQAGGQPYGLTILNDGQFGSDIKDGVMRLTLLRSPAYAHHEPSVFDPDRGYTIMDQGWHSVRVRLLPHDGPLDLASAVRAGWAFNAPPTVHHESAHPGTRPQQASFLSIDAPSVVVGVVKGAEDGADLVVRARECAGQACPASLTVAGAPAPFPLRFAPFEVKTVRIAPGAWTCREVSLLED